MFIRLNERDSARRHERATTMSNVIYTAYTIDTDDTTYAVDAAEVAMWIAEETITAVDTDMVAEWLGIEADTDETIEAVDTDMVAKWLGL